MRARACARGADDLINTHLSRPQFLLRALQESYPLLLS